MSLLINAAPSGAKVCQPFTLQVMVFSPESGYKFNLSVQRQCSDTDEATWKLVFNLYKKNNKGEFVELVHVSFTAESEEESKGIESMANDGVSFDAARKVQSNVYPAVKKLGNNPHPTDQDKQDVRNGFVSATKAQVTHLDI